MAQIPAGTRVQSLAFDRRAYDGSEARAWARSHEDFRVARTRSDGDWIVMQQEPRSRFIEGSFRQITIDDGVQALVAEPKVQLAEPRKRKKKRTPFSWEDPIAWLLEWLIDA